jgi:hypothetical protein
VFEAENGERIAVPMEASDERRKGPVVVDGVEYQRVIVGVQICVPLVHSASYWTEAVKGGVTRESMVARENVRLAKEMQENPHVRPITPKNQPREFTSHFNAELGRAREEARASDG